MKGITAILLKPPLWADAAVWAAAIAFTGGSAAALCLTVRASAWACVLYAVTLLLYVLSLYLVLTFRDIPERIVKNAHVRRFVADFGFRSYVLTVCSAALNALYAVTGTVVAAIGRSAWLGALVWYHTVLAISRGLSILTVHRHAADDKAKYERRVCLFVGVMLLVLSLATIPLVILVARGHTFYTFYGGAIVFCTALTGYTVIKLLFSVKSIRRARAAGDLALAAVTDLNTADALISVFALQATLFSAFGGLAARSIAQPITGGAIIVLILALGIAMIVRSRGKNRHINQDM